MNLYSFDDMELTAQANGIKEQLLDALEREGLLTKPASEIAAQYAVVLHKPGWLGRVLSAVLFKDPKASDMRVDVFKVVR